MYFACLAVQSSANACICVHWRAMGPHQQCIRPFWALRPGTHGPSCPSNTQCTAVSTDLKRPKRQLSVDTEASTQLHDGHAPDNYTPSPRYTLQYSPAHSRQRTRDAPGPPPARHFNGSLQQSVRHLPHSVQAFYAGLGSAPEGCNSRGGPSNARARPLRNQARSGLQCDACAYHPSCHPEKQAGLGH